MKSKKNGVLFVVILIVAVILVYMLGSEKENTLIGEWKYQLRDIYSFSKDNTFKINVNGFVYNEGEYRVDDSKDPIWIDFIPKKVRVVADHYTPPMAKGIMRFQDPSVVEIALSPDSSHSIFGGERPKSFNEEDILIFTLIREK